jgi:hypothetical protein
MENYKALKHIQQTRHVSIGEVVDAALSEYFAPPEAKKDTALILRRLDLLGQRQSVSEANLKILGEMIALYVRIFLTNTEEVPKDAKQAAIAKGTRRYNGYLDKVAANLAASEGKLAELLQQIFIDNDAEEEEADDMESLLEETA